MPGTQTGALWKMLLATFSASRSRRKAPEFRTSNIFVIVVTSMQLDAKLDGLAICKTQISERGLQSTGWRHLPRIGQAGR
jgi:hypothetical protein